MNWTLRNIKRNWKWIRPVRHVIRSNKIIKLNLVKLRFQTKFKCPNLSGPKHNETSCFVKTCIVGFRRSKRRGIRVGDPIVACVHMLVVVRVWFAKLPAKISSTSLSASACIISRNPVTLSVQVVSHSEKLGNRHVAHGQHCWHER